MKPLALSLWLLGWPALLKWQPDDVSTMSDGAAAWRLFFIALTWLVGACLIIECDR